MDVDDGSIMPWLIIAALFLCAAYFALAETAFSSVNRIRLRMLVDKGDRRAVKAQKVLDNFDRAITTILIGTNITHAAVAAYATVLATRIWGMSIVAASTVITTLLVFFISEMLPKSIAKKYSERLSLAVASSLCFFMFIFGPLAKALSALGTAVAKHSKGDMEYTVTEDELYDIVETMKDEGEIDRGRGELLHSALDFADVTVESILTARVDVAAIDVETSCTDILETIKLQRHSRLPVYRSNIDNVVGVLQIRKYVKAWLKQGDSVELEPLLDEAYFVHQSANIDELLPKLSRNKTNLAIVTDSYGGTVGIVTVEDILEELVGEIWDEDDEIVECFISLPDGSFELDASLDIEDAFDMMGFDDPDDADFEHKLMGEWAYEQFDRIPFVGDSFEYNGLSVAISEMRQNRIIKLIATIQPACAEQGGDEQ